MTDIKLAKALFEWHFAPCLKTILASGTVGIVAVGLALHSLAAAPGTNGFGFSGPEIFPIENQISLLRVADQIGRAHV